MPFQVLSGRRGARPNRRLDRLAFERVIRLAVVPFVAKPAAHARPGEALNQADHPSSPVVRFGPDEPFRLDSGRRLDHLQIAYQTYGTLNADKSNAILICHALTGDQHVASTHPVTGKPGWWSDMVGSGKPIDTLFPDTYAYFAPRRAGRTGTGGVDPSEECFLLAALGIENGTPFDPDAAMKQLLGEAARHDTDCPGPGDVTSRPHGS